jgi:hypothetical protein
VCEVGAWEGGRVLCVGVQVKMEEDVRRGCGRCV